MLKSTCQPHITTTVKISENAVKNQIVRQYLFTL